MPLEPLAEKWRAFGFETLECDGHDPAALVAEQQEVPAQPTQRRQQVRFTVPVEALVDVAQGLRFTYAEFNAEVDVVARGLMARGIAVGDRVDAMITAVDKASRRISVSIKALEMKDEQEAIEQFGSSDSGASLGDILGAALKNAGTKD